MTKSPRRLSRRTGVGIALVLAIAAIVVIVLAVQAPSPTEASGTGGQPSGAVTVERRNLVETDTQSGTLSYAGSWTVYNRLGGTLTWLPSVGQLIRPGQALYKVSGRPVILMNGTTPAYRDLSAADTPGPDILELNRSLVGLGYTSEGIVEDDVWQAGTTAAVEVFQESIGESPTGVLRLGQIVFLPGNQLVAAVESTLGSGSGGSAASDPAPTSPAEFVSLNTSTTPTPAGPGATPPRKPRSGSPRNFRRGSPRRSPRRITVAALLALLRAESAQLSAATAELRAAQAAARGTPGKQESGSGNPRGAGGGNAGAGGARGNPGGSAAGGAGGGNPGGNPGGGNPGAGSGSGGSATPVLLTSSTRLIVTVDLDASKQSEARVGEKVTVQMPNGTTVNGTVAAVSSVAQSSNGFGSGTGGADSGNGGSSSGNGGGTSGATIPVTVTLSRHLSGAGLDQAAVSVNFAQAAADNVLSVPVTALLATAGGGYAVQAAAAPHRLIPVTTGLFAAGDVQISGPGIYPGLQVTDSQG